ncbi:uncharacterized protein BO72DRAFT_458839 [Aspergillus fijiensis CBS 313.89]|uniref:2EXR domain-containing protein n=1 Tax=Aspergillus fijiensis CBS 313.89 TaxID=1448319 RepID=A0A8G1RV09_9EURO|nr:uncharacterized protein BO72DRAFT_458839 [Aspergillus fijiensis CBS 313.89]RAK77271.1 hypothetical protein BO72DRAFT_458839 [Aspergillus fijiensis CBS 313.89]
MADVTTPTPKTFNPFKRLPPELRTLKWEFAWPDLRLHHAVRLCPAAECHWKLYCGDDSDRAYTEMKPASLKIMMPAMTAANREARALSRKLVRRSLYEYFEPCPTATLTPPSEESDPWLAFDWRTRRYTFRRLYASDTVVYLSPAEFEAILLARIRCQNSRSYLFETIAVPLTLLQRHSEALRVLSEYFTRLSYVMVVVNDLDDRQNQTEQQQEQQPDRQHERPQSWWGQFVQWSSGAAQEEGQQRQQQPKRNNTKKTGWWVDNSHWAQGKYLGPDPATPGVGDWIHEEKAMLKTNVYSIIQRAYRRVPALDRAQLRVCPVRACHKEDGWIGMASGSRYSGMDMALQVSPIEPLLLTAPDGPIISIYSEPKVVLSRHSFVIESKPEGESFVFFMVFFFLTLLPEIAFIYLLNLIAHLLCASKYCTYSLDPLIVAHYMIPYFSGLTENSLLSSLSLHD